MTHYGFGGLKVPDGESVDGLPRVALPDDFIRMRDAARAKNSASAAAAVASDVDSCPELEGSVADSDTVASEITQVSSNVGTDETAHSDGLLVEDEVIDQILETAVKEVQASLSSTTLNDTVTTSTAPNAQAGPVLTKREDELAGLQAAISNAVSRGSCPAEKLSIVEKVANKTPPEPESPPDAPRDPRDRRKRMRSGCFRYVCRPETPNSIASLVTELKLTFDEYAIGLKLSEIFSALESHPDRPLEDTWWGVSKIFVFEK